MYKNIQISDLISSINTFAQVKKQENVIGYTIRSILLVMAPSVNSVMSLVTINLGTIKEFAKMTLR